MLGEGVDVVIRPPDAALAQMGDFVRDMHTGSGLLDQRGVRRPARCLDASRPPRCQP